jgi:hypothetical protein
MSFFKKEDKILTFNAFTHTKIYCCDCEYNHNRSCYHSNNLQLDENYVYRPVYIIKDSQEKLNKKNKCNLFLQRKEYCNEKKTNLG